MPNVLNVAFSVRWDGSWSNIWTEDDTDGLHRLGRRVLRRWCYTCFTRKRASISTGRQMVPLAFPTPHSSCEKAGSMGLTFMDEVHMHHLKCGHKSFRQWVWSQSGTIQFWWIVLSELCRMNIVIVNCKKCYSWPQFSLEFYYFG